jgi:4-hydroxybenzoate polyprenyltransferase
VASVRNLKVPGRQENIMRETKAQIWLSIISAIVLVVLGAITVKAFAWLAAVFYISAGVLFLAVAYRMFRHRVGMFGY